MSAHRSLSHERSIQASVTYISSLTIISFVLKLPPCPGPHEGPNNDETTSE